MDMMNQVNSTEPMMNMPVGEEEEPMVGGRGRKMTLSILVILVVVAGGLAFYFYRQLAVLKQDPQKVAQEEAGALVVAVGKLMVLPEGEQPTVATVTDPQKLKEQPFFINAQVGDKVLIYTNAKKAILYNPTTNKIVEVAPLSIGNPAK